LDVSIVIPVYNALALTRQCLKSIYEHGAAVSFEVVVVDNGSAADMEEYFRAEVQLRANLRYLRYDAPLGFARAVNVGAAASTGDVLIVLNSDTLVTPRWMNELHALLLADPSLGAITPATNHAGEPAQMDYATVDLSAAKALALVARRAAAAKQGTAPRLLYLPQRLTFFCVALRREVWLTFDGLDERYEVGNFEDEDLCMRLRVAGYRLGVAMHVFVYHHNNATFTANKISHSGWMTRNVAVFASRARAFAEADPAETAAALRWPRRSAGDISVIVLPVEGGSLERTLRSLENQTVTDFEVILPNSAELPTRSWIAYVNQGDILYPFHLEALHEALVRTSMESIYADGWVKDASSAQPHPDVSKSIRSAPLLLAGWMHHSSVHRDRIFEESVPIHWPRLTWEAAQQAEVPAHADAIAPSTWDPTEWARTAYRKLFPLELRHGIDRTIRRIIGRPQIDPEVHQLQLLAAHLQGLMASGVDAGKFAIDDTLPAVVMFNAVSWNSVNQRQHHFARGLGERGHTVFWVEPALSPPRNWWTSRPLQEVAPGVHLLRLPGNARDIYSLQWNDATVDVMAAAIRQTLAAYGVQQAVTLINYPRFQPIVKRLRETYAQKIASDCLDDQRALAGIYQTVLFSYEDWLLEHADLLVTSSVVLQQKLHTRPCTLLHNACDFDLFSETASMGHLTHLPRPIVGFFGALADWLDMELIHDAAEHFPQWTFVYIGPPTFSNSAVEVEWIAKTNLPNIVVMPSMNLRELAAHLADFDVCTMPFRDMLVTHSMNPVKVYEYLAAGKPVVARDLPEVRYLADNEAPGLIQLYKTPKQFFACLEAALADDNEELRVRRRAFAQANDWDRRLDELSALLCALAKE
jgi:GT2 family glycosyltransferase/glycosyltransferase involved in cell wall biosynthesis